MKAVQRAAVVSLVAALIAMSSFLLGCEKDGDDAGAVIGSSSSTAVEQGVTSTIGEQVTTTIDQQDGDTAGGLTVVAVELRIGVPVEFQLAGATHSAELVRVAGASVEVVIASASPTTYLLTEGQDTGADLDGDAVPETSLTVSEVGADSATLSATSGASPSFNETDFATQGGLAPYKARSFYECDPCAVTLDDGSILLFYTSLDRRWVQWERYGPDGAQITAPQLGAGRVDPVESTELGEIIDVVRIGDSIFMVSETVWGMVGNRYDLSMRPLGVASFLTPWSEDAALATDGERLWLATQQFYAPGAPREGRDAVAIMEIAPGTPPIRMRATLLTEPPVGTDDVAPDIVYDAGSGNIVVVYERIESARRDTTDLRLAVVDPGTLAVVRDIAVASVEDLDDATSVAVTTTGGEALVFWRSGGALPQNLVSVDLDSGAVSTVLEAMPEDGIAYLRGNNRDLEFVELTGGPALLFHDPLAMEGVTDPHTDRFVLQPLAGDGLAGAAIILDGGQPVLADVTFDLGSLRANPKKAICGSPCLLSGTVVNRGSRDARNVTLEVRLDGELLGTLDLGKIEAGDSLTFAKVWDVPPDLTAEQATVEYRLTTSEEQYTLDNDAATTMVEVRQKGLVQGRVTNASGVVPPEWWAAGLAGVTVSFGGKTVLTDAAGTFAIEEVEFGSGTLTATKDGFNPVSLEVETKRTAPIASAGIRMDNHGTLRILVTDEETGEGLSAVQVFMPGYARTDKTDKDGEVVYSIPHGTYRFAFKKSGYQAVPPVEFVVELGTERTETLTMREATTALLSGRVVDRKGLGVPGATVTIKDAQDEVVARPTVDSNGDFAEVELSTKPRGSYVIVASGDGITVEEPVSLSGGEVASVMVELVPGRGELAQRQATEGYTSWMLKAAWPGFLDVGGQSIYVWYGNYAIRVGAQYWDGSRELSRVEVTAWGGTYETHVTKGEIEFSVSGDDLTGTGGKKLPPPMGEATDAASQAWWKTAWKTGKGFYDEHKDALNLGKQIYTGIKKVKEAWSDQDRWLMLGQGPELLTWKESLEDFNVRPKWDWDHPLDSILSYKEAIPMSFAIPIVIGGSSVQETAVRVDGIDVVDKESGEVYFTDRATWYSYQGVEGDNSAFNAFEMPTTDINTEDVRILVWITVQKYWQGAPGGTCFDQREQQVVIFDPDTGGMKAMIAPGDTYKAPERWTTEEIRRLVGD